MRPLDLALARPVSERGRIVAQDRVGREKDKDGRVPPVNRSQLADPV